MRLFVTGTDTGVGKTVVAAGLARLLNRRGFDVGVLKPVETGCGDGIGNDGRLLAEAAGQNPAAVAPITYCKPLAPLAAAREQARPVDLELLDAAFTQQKADWMVVEGAGGLSVPLTEDLDMAGLAGRWRLPLLIVARPGLGTINHSFLTVHYARSRGLDVLGVVLSGWPTGDRADLDPSLRNNPAMIEELCGVPVLGLVPWCEPMLSVDDAASAVEAAGLVDRLLHE